MSESILTSTKKLLGITEEDTSFDVDITMHINSVFSDLTQLGVGPEQGFEITDKSTEWVTYLEDDRQLNSVKSYMYFRLRLMFDPPAAGPGIASFEKQIEKLEFRLNIRKESTDWADPRLAVPSTLVLDDGM